MTAAKKMTQAKRKSERVESEQASEAFDLGAFARSNGEAFETFIKANQAMMDGWAALNQELMAFTDRRLREEFERTESLIGCSNPEDAFKLHCGFAKTAGEDYLAETQKLMGLMMEISRGCWAPVEDRTRQALHGLGQAEPKAD